MKFTNSVDSFAEQREVLVVQLREQGIRNKRLLKAIGSVRREDFLPSQCSRLAYADSALEIGFQQTISQPYTVAFMIELLELKGDERVLEIGTGSGYAAAILSLLAREVYTLERIPELATQARERLTRLGYRGVQVCEGDGTLGLPAFAPYDAIIVAAGGTELPMALVEQLTTEGCIVMPIGPSQHRQEMVRGTKHAGELILEKWGNFTFVPLIGQHAWPA